MNKFSFKSSYIDFELKLIQLTKMIKIVSLFAMVPLGQCLRIHHTEADYTCQKYYDEPILEGETGMVGPESKFEFSSLFRDDGQHDQPWFHGRERGFWAPGSEYPNSQWV